MSHQAISPSQAIYHFTLSHEQTLNIATSLASDIGVASDVMPRDFLLRHYNLLEMLLEKLTQDERNHVLGAITYLGASQ